MSVAFNHSTQFTSLAGSSFPSTTGTMQLHKQSEGPDGANLFIYHIPPGYKLIIFVGGGGGAGAVFFIYHIPPGYQAYSIREGDIFEAGLC